MLFKQQLFNSLAGWIIMQNTTQIKVFSCKIQAGFYVLTRSPFVAPLGTPRRCAEKRGARGCLPPRGSLSPGLLPAPGSRRRPWPQNAAVALRPMVVLRLQVSMRHVPDPLCFVRFCLFSLSLSSLRVVRRLYTTHIEEIYWTSSCWK